MSLYGLDSLGNSIDWLSRTLDQTRNAVEGVDVRIASAAEALQNQLVEATTSIRDSADVIKFGVENTSTWLTDALKVGTETGSKNARQIKDQIAELSLNLTYASRELQTASMQSSRLSGRLNWLTDALVFAAILTAGATVFQAYETKRQADLIQEQLRQSKQSPPAVSKSQPEPQTQITKPK